VCGSDVKLAQLIGRAVRACPLDRFPEQARFGEKTRAIVFDPAGQFSAKRLMREDRLGTDGKPLKRLPKDPQKRGEAAIARLERLPEAVAFGSLGEWAVALRELALRRGGADWARLHRPILHPAERALPAPPHWWGDARMLYGRAARVIQPLSQRHAIRALVEAAGTPAATVADPPRGAALDLLIYLRYVASVAADAQRHAAQVQGRDRVHHIRRAQIWARHSVEIPDSILLPGQLDIDSESADDEDAL
jgi:hypothetical protein